jgi:phage shock protein A
MNRFLEGVRALFLKKVGAVLDKARSLRDLAADVATYAADRRRGGDGGSGAGSDPVAAILKQLLIEAGCRLIDVKQEVVVRIADERRLAKVVEHETKEAAAWSRLVTAAEDKGDQALVAEARERERGHAEQARRSEAQLEQQRADNERLRYALRALYDRFEGAERARDRIVARRTAPRAQRTTQQDLRWIDEALRLFEGLAALEELRDEEASGGGDGLQRSASQT